MKASDVAGWQAIARITCKINELQNNALPLCSTIISLGSNNIRNETVKLLKIGVEWGGKGPTSPRNQKHAD